MLSHRRQVLLRARQRRVLPCDWRCAGVAPRCIQLCTDGGRVHCRMFQCRGVVSARCRRRSDAGGHWQHRRRRWRVLQRCARYYHMLQRRGVVSAHCRWLSGAGGQWQHRWRGRRLLQRRARHYRVTQRRGVVSARCRRRTGAGGHWQHRRRRQRLLQRCARVTTVVCPAPRCCRANGGQQCDVARRRRRGWSYDAARGRPLCVRSLCKRCERCWSAKWGHDHIRYFFRIQGGMCILACAKSCGLQNRRLKC